MSNKIPTIYTRVNPATVTTDIHIIGEITEPRDYVEEMQHIREAGEGDTINLYINSPGGRVDTAVQLVNCLRNSPAKVVAHIEGQCHSAATYIFLTADEWKVNHDCIMLIHNYSGGAMGKGSEIKQNAEANENWITKLMYNIYKSFLTEEEIAKVCLNQDIWLTSERILERLANVLAYRESETVRLEEESRQEILKQVQDIVKDSEEDSSGVQESSPEL